ncbi:hypothetical protein PM082_018161 [Marasmius tenuissimus]|nr:hypothetical protein PM082_018161 [Marasmius tenuissimus]
MTASKDSTQSLHVHGSAKPQQLSQATHHERTNRPPSKIIKISSDEEEEVARPPKRKWMNESASKPYGWTGTTNTSQHLNQSVQGKEPPLQKKHVEFVANHEAKVKKQEKKIQNLKNFWRSANKESK